MDKQTLEKNWHTLSGDVISGMVDWRVQHPKATLREIEAALDERLECLRAKMLEEAALFSQARDWGEAGGKIPRCPVCGTELERSTEGVRTLQTQGDQVVQLTRRYGECPQCGSGIFPLDEELGLLPGHLTPHAHECLVRFGTWMPFEKAVAELQFSLKVTVSEPSVRRYTQAAGAAYEQWQTQEVERLERETPLAPLGPAKLYLSADGAFVPVVGGEWAEVKTMVIGEVGQPVQEKDEWVVHTHNLSYFSRLAEAETFTRLALVETHRRGVENAAQVGAVQDGAEWLQGFVDWHRPNAVRILDFSHAGGYVAKIGQTTFGADTPELAAWLTSHLHDLKHEGPDNVLAELQEMVQKHPKANELELPKTVAYLEKRTPQMQYPTFQTQGWPIGSGATESSHKSVVEARLKGAGMHWARSHINPMLALRNIACNDRWAEAWGQITTILRQQQREQAQTRRRQRQKARDAARLEQPVELERVPAAVVSQPPQATITPTAPSQTAEPKTSRPAPNHPWRRSPIGHAQYWPASTFTSKN